MIPKDVLLLAMVLSANAATAAEVVECDRVSWIDLHPDACLGRRVEMDAYLVWTQHGSYVTEGPRRKHVVSVAYSKAEEDRKAVEEIRSASLRSAFDGGGATLRGRFQGTIEKAPSGRPRLVIRAAVVDQP